MRTTATLLFIAAVAPTQGQQLRSPFSHLFLERGAGGATSVSSSYVSSSSWVSGADGRMHQEKHEVTRETVRDPATGQMVQRETSEVNCKDGNCQRTVHVQASMNAASDQMTMGMMARWMPNLHTLPQRHINWAFAFPPVVKQTRPEPLIVVRLAPSHGFLAPRPLQAGVAPANHNKEYAFAFAGLVVFASATGMIALAALLRCHRQSLVSASEQPIQALGQPLGPISEASSPFHGFSSKVTPTRLAPQPKAETSYLCAVYQKAAAVAEIRVTREYLHRVYMKNM